MPASPLRYDRLIKEIPKHKTMGGALIASGFTKQTAKKAGKSVVRSALKHQAREILKMDDKSPVKAKQLMSDLLGLTRNELFDALKKIALQDKDYGSALKVLAPISREHDIILSTDDDKASITVPVLNIMVGKTSSDNMAINGEQQTTPLIDDVKNG